MTIGQTIRIFRIANDYTIYELSKRIGYSTSYLCEIEKNKKGYNTLSSTIEILEKSLNVPYGSIKKVYKLSEEKSLNFKQTLYEVLKIMLKD